MGEDGVDEVPLVEWGGLLPTPRPARQADYDNDCNDEYDRYRHKDGTRARELPWAATQRGRGSGEGGGRWRDRGATVQ